MIWRNANLFDRRATAPRGTMMSHPACEFTAAGPGPVSAGHRDASGGVA
jgi:hypothetical protein